MEFYSIYLNKIRCFETLIFFLTHGPDEISAAMFLNLNHRYHWAARGSRFRPGWGRGP
ncbi:hypothetical protein HanRHA438_Chr01g0024641 [Helianthus annuus]|nr:hypothetical protein HanRHA438_Chr01g0024641 [Helianthus annuus]